MIKKIWPTLVDTTGNVERTQVFSGGACNVLTNTGTLIRNAERDPINQWLSDQGIYFFDPQIHPDTHGVEYDYHVHFPLEKRAREKAKINLYEISPRTFGGITSLEIAADHFRDREPMVIYYSDGKPGSDTIPEHSDRGHPLFQPDGIDGSKPARLAHYREFIKNGNNMRKYVMSFAREIDTLTVDFSNDPAGGDVVITPYRMHAVDLFRALVRAASRERVFVTFTGDARARDSRGNPIFMLPTDPPEVELDALLDQYRDEGNALRRAIAGLVEISVFLRVVYTQRSCIRALEEVLTINGLLEDTQAMRPGSALEGE